MHDLQPVLAPSEPYWNASEYRAPLMGKPGDIVALWTRRVPAFEAYCREVLGILDVEIVHVRRAGGSISLAQQCQRDPAVFARMVRLAAENGGLNVIPYIGVESAWSLAAAIAWRAGVRVHVAAPRPRLARAANNKLWFTGIVGEVLGEHATPPTAAVHGPSVLTAVLRALARDHESIALKLPSASAGTGNLVVESDPIRRASWHALDNALGRLFRGMKWDRPFPLLVSVWERPVIMTPSVQLWLPARGQGEPVVEGIFQQEVTGPASEFMGASPADLPRSWRNRLAREATLLTLLLQELGYFGRCSLDAILVGPSLDGAELHWVECNGRWGGTSIPLTVVNRLTGGSRPYPFVIICDAARRTFSMALDRTQDLLFRPGDPGGIVYLSPGDAAARRGIDFLAIGRSLEDARRRAREARERLTA